MLTNLNLQWNCYQKDHTQFESISNVKFILVEIFFSNNISVQWINLFIIFLKIIFNWTIFSVFLLHSCLVMVGFYQPWIHICSYGLPIKMLHQLMYTFLHTEDLLAIQQHLRAIQINFMVSLTQISKKYGHFTKFKFSIPIFDSLFF